MKITLLIAQIIISIVLTVLILLQSKGMGLSGVFGGSIGTYSTKRGVEKVVFNLTIVFAALFFLSSLAQLLVQ